MRIRVVKRRGFEEPFSIEKLEKSIINALKCAGIDLKEAPRIVSKVLEILESRMVKEKVHASEISDTVELVFVQKAIKNPLWLNAAKCYALHRIYSDAGKVSAKFSKTDLSLSFNALKVLESRYLLRDPKTGRIIETPDDMFKRVAYAIAEAEKYYGASESKVEEYAKKFYEIMSELKFIPNSPTLMNAGAPLGQLSACFVIPVADDLNGIFEALKITALIQKTGGGVGADFSELRPKGDVIETTGGVSSGPISFMKIFDMATEVIKEGGKRRGANMGIMHMWHPDIEEFIMSKCGHEEVLKNFNISVAVYDSFMEAVLEDKEWPLINPRKCPEIKNALGKEVLNIARKCLEKNVKVKWVKAKHLFDKIIMCAWKTGDPGLVFIDEINRHNPTPKLGKIRSTNPCVTGDTRILTANGWVPIAKLFEEAKRRGIIAGIVEKEREISKLGEDKGYETEILVPYGEKLIPTKAVVWKIGLKNVCRVIFKEGFELKATPEHRIKLKHGPWVKVSELKEGDKVETYGLWIKEATVERVERLGEHMVYDLSVPGYGCYISEGILSHNCGEVPALSWESCNLGSINLEKFVRYVNGRPKIDWEGLREVVELAVRFLDNVITVNKFPCDEIREATLRTRKIGLGVMGWAHFLIKLRIPYDSDDAYFIADKVMEWIAYCGKVASIRLAKERGTFPAFKDSIFVEGRLNFEPQIEHSKIYNEEKVSEYAKELVKDRPKINWNAVKEEIKKHGIRNATVTTIAPTGSISIIANTSAGIEPLFAIAYIRQISIGRFLEVNKLFIEELSKLGMLNEERIWEIAEKGSIQEIPWVPQELKRIYRTAHDIDPISHVKMQAVFQRWVDNAVSKTVNLRYEATIDNVRKVYLEAWRLKCKGITVYRDKSKKEQVIYVGVKEELFKVKPREWKLAKLMPIRFRLKKKEYHAAPEDYAGGCPTCNV